MTHVKKIISNTGEPMLSARAAAARLSCAPDYIGKLCRDAKIAGTQVKGVWFVEASSLAAFETARAEAKVQRSQELSVLRRKEQKAHALASQSAVGKFFMPVREALSSKHGVKTFALSAALGLMVFWGSAFIASDNKNLAAALAQINSPFFGTGSHVSLGSTNDSFKNFFLSLFWHENKTNLVQTNSPVVATSTAVATTPVHIASTTIVQNTYPIRERVVEKVTTVSGLTRAELDQRLSELSNSLTSKIYELSSQNTVVNFAPGERIDKLSNVVITNGTVHGLSGLTDGDIPDDITASNYLPKSGYTQGDVVYANASGDLVALPIGSTGQVLKVIGGVPVWGTNVGGGGGGGGAWATTTDNLALYPADPTQVVLVGNVATTTTGNIFEVTGNSLFRNAIVSYGTVTAPRFVATSSAASVLPYASSTALTVSGIGYFETASTSNLTISSITNALLKTDATGVVSAAVAGSDYVSPAITISAGTGLTGGGDLSANRTISLNTANANTWTALQEFRNASSTLSSVYDTLYVGRTATTTIRGDGLASILPFASSTAISVSGTGYFGTASTSNLTISNVPSAILKTNSSGAVIPAVAGLDYQTFSYLFPSNATTTHIAFNGGLTAAGATTTALSVTGSTTVAGQLNATGGATFGTITAGAATFGSIVNNGTLTVAGLSNFSYASSTQLSALDGLYVGRTATTTIRGDGLASILPYASSTALTVSGIGYFGTASTTNLTVSSVAAALLKTTAGGVVSAAIAGTDYVNGSGTPGNCVQWGASNTLTDAGSACGTGTGSGGFSFTPTTNYGALANATSTPMWFQAGLQASSTSHFANADFLSATSSFLAITGSTTVAGQFNAVGGASFGSASFTGAITSTANSANTLPFASSTALTVSGTGYFGTASTTNLFISSIVAGNLLKTTTDGSVVSAIAGTDFVTPAGLASAYPFPLTGNATSTLTQFNGGLTAFASSTIGNGTQGGGLTINGGATTTGSLYVAGTATSTFLGNISISGSIIPSANNTYYLGSVDKMWHSVYIGPGSLYVNGQKVISTNGSNDVVVSTDPGENLVLQTSGTSNIELNPTGGQIQIKNTVNVTAGKSITTTDLSALLIPNGVAAGNITIGSNSITATNLNGGISITPTGAGGTYVTSGNVGIGNTNPSEKLNVQGAVAAHYFTATSTTGVSTFGLASTTLLSSLDGVYVGRTATTTIRGDGIASILPYASSTALTVSGSFYGAGLSTCNTSTDKLLWNNGNFSCGTDQTTAGGGGSDSNWTFFNGAGLRLATTTNQIVIGNTSTSSLAALEVYPQGNNPAAFFSGNVGIGTTSPYAKLSIAGQAVAEYFTATSSTQTNTFPLLSATTATTTNLAVTGVTSALLKTNSLGQILAAVGGVDYANFAYPFPGNATSTALAFNAGLTAFASSTIGSGTQAGGLTIFGGATTTGNLLVQGSATTSNLAVTGSTTIAGQFNATAGATLGALTAGASNLSSLTVTGATSLQAATSTSFAVTGSSTVASVFNALGGANFGTASFTGAITSTANSANTLPFASSTALTVSGTGYFGTASTTNLTISSIASGNLLKTTTAGSVIAAVAGVDYATPSQVGSAFPFTPAAWGNSTSTVIGFTAGIFSNASSTFTILQAASTTLTGPLTFANATGTSLSVTGSTTITGQLNAVGGGVLNITKATTTGLAISGIASSILKTDSSGNVIPAVLGTDYQNFGYLFPGNATTTQLVFNGGLTAVGATTTALAVTGSTTINSVLNLGGTLNANGALTVLGNTSLQDATSTSFAISGISSGNLLKTTTGGAVIAAVAGTDYATPSQVAAVFPFTANSNYGALANSTSTPIWFQAGFQASSTSQIAYASTTGITVAGLASTTNLTVSSLTSGRVPFVTTAGSITDSANLTFNGTTFTTPFASSTALTVSGTGYFGTASTTNLTISSIASGNLLKTTTAGSVIAAVAGIDYATPGQVTSFSFTPTSNYGAVANATSTAIWFQNGLQASSTSHFVLADFASATSTNLAVTGSTTINTLNLTNALSVAQGGIGATTLNDLITLGTHTTGNYLATLSSAGSLTIVGSGAENAAVTANLNLSNPNSWLALQEFRNSSSTLASVYDTLYIGRTATTTIRGDGFASIIPYASSTALTVSGSFYGSGLTSCSSSSDKLLWTNGVFSCGTDGGSAGTDYNWTFFNGSGVRLATTSAQVLLGATATSSAVVPLAAFNVIGGAGFDEATSTALFATTASSTNLTVGNNAAVLGNLGVGTTSPYARLSIAGGNIIQIATGTLAIATSTPTTDHTYASVVSGRYLYVADSLNGLKIYDNSNPRKMALMGTYAGATGAASVAVAGKYAYVGDTNQGLVIVDVSNPGSPTLVGSFAGGDAYGLAISGKYVFTTNFTGGTVNVVDVSDPRTPVGVSSISTGGNPYALAVQGKYLYVANQSNGRLQIYDISNQKTPALAGQYTGAVSPAGVYVSGPYAYLGDASQGLFIINIANPANPTLVSNYDTSASYVGVTVAGNYVYASDHAGFLKVIDVTNPATPRSAGTISVVGLPYGVNVAGKYAYVAADDQGLQVVDINGIESPSAHIGSIAANTIDISDTLSVGGNIFAGGGLDVGISGIFSRGPISAFIASTTQSNPTVANFMGGNVGIGTTSPYAALSVVGSTGVVAELYTATGTRASILPYASSTALSVSGAGYFGSASTTNLTVSSLTSGRVPFVTTAGSITDSANLTFNGTTFTTPFASSTALTVSGTGYFGTASTTNLTISSIASGNLLKTTTAGSVIAAVAGTDYVTPAGLTSAFPFTPAAWGNSTSTVIGFTQGIFSNASSTFTILQAASTTLTGPLTFANATGTSLSVTGSTTIAGQFNATAGATLGALTAGASNLSSLTVTGATSLQNASTTNLSGNTLAIGGTATTSISAAGVITSNATSAHTLNFASSTAITVSGTGYFGTASTTNLTISSIASGNLLKITTAGSVIAAVAGTDYATPAQISGAFGFTPTTNYGAAANSTSTPIWFTAGLQASSTSHFAAFDFISATGSALAVTGSTTIAGQFNATAGATLGALTAGASTLSSLTVTGATSLQGATSTSLAVTGSTTVSSVLNVGGVVNANGGLTAIGATSTALAVTGSTTLQLVNIGGSLNANGALTVAGNTSLQGATSTSFAVSGISSGNIVKTTTGGALVAAVAGTDYVTPAGLTSAFPFTPAAWGNSTSTVIGFTAGIFSNASSTFTILQAASTTLTGPLTFANATGTSLSVTGSTTVAGVLNARGGANFGTASFTGAITSTANTANTLPYASSTALTVSGTGFFGNISSTGSTTVAGVLNAVGGANFGTASFTGSITSTANTANTLPFASTTNITSTLASTTNLTVSSLTSGRVPFVTTAGALTDSANLTFNGTTLTANTLNLTNVLTVGNGGTGANSLTGIIKGNGSSAFTAITTSAGISGELSDETGTGGALVFASSPTIASPTLTGLTSLALASSTQQSILDALYIGRTATTTIRGDGVASTLPYASSTALTVSGTGYFGTASTTNLTISSIASGNLLKTTTAGSVIAAVAGTDYVTPAGLTSAFPFTPAAWGNSTSTVIGFTAGIFSNASSTFTILQAASTTLTGPLTFANATGTSLSVTGSTTIAGQFNATAGATLGTLTAGASTLSSLSVTGATSLQAATSTSFAVTGSSTVASVFNALGGANFGTASFTGAITSTANSANTLPFASSTALTVSGTGYFGTASTTNLTISSIASGNLLKTTTAGSVIAAVAGTDYATPAQVTSAYPFQLTGNATSTLTQFNGGLTAFASSTIGSGTQAGGLTIFGGATTTGNLLVQGSATTTSFAATGSTTIAGQFNAVGGATLGTLTAGASTLSSLSVTGNTTLANATSTSFAVSSSSTVAGVFNARGGANFGTASFTGAITSTANSANTLPFASTTNITSTLASTTNLTISSIASGNLLKTTTAGSVVAAVAGSDYLTSALTAIGPTGQTTTGPTVTLATSTTGSDFTITTSGSTVTFNLPNASASNTGKLTATDWSNFNSKLGTSSIDTSAELLSVLTDETGSGLAVFGTSPTFSGTPVFSGGVLNFSVNSTSTIPNNSPFAFTIATSTTAQPLFRIDTTSGAETVTLGNSSGDVTIGDTGAPVNLVFAENSTIKTAGGKTLTFGAGADKINFAVNTGFGSTTPYALLGIHATSTTGIGSPTTLFAIGSSTAGTATSTLFSVSNTGTTTLGRFGACSGSSALTTDSSGNIICGSISASGAFNFTPATWGNSTSTVIGFTAGIFSNASSTFTILQAASTTLTGNLTFGNATGTSLSVTGSSTIAGVFNARGGANFGTASFTGAITSTANSANTLPFASSTALTVSGTGYFGTASTTNLTISSIASGNLLKTTTAGSVIAAVAGTDYATPAQVTSAYPFQLTGNATSTLTQFNGGLTAFASSTIGSGTQAGGLTIFGGATTTGNLLVQGTGTSSFTGNLSVTGAFNLGNTLRYSNTSVEVYGGELHVTGGDTVLSGGALNVTGGNAILPYPTDALKTQLGIGTTSPYAYLSIHANNGTTNRNLFAIGSSTASATSTLFTVNNTGSTTLFQIPSSILKTNANGTIIAAVAGTDYATPAGAFDFTPTTNFGAVANSTSTAIWFQNGLQASSTVRLSDITTSGIINFASTTVSTTTLLALNGSPFLSASTTKAFISLGWNTGTSTANNRRSIFMSDGAGQYASGASNSNFFGYNAGQYANGANASNFFGDSAGYNATNAYSSNFFGTTAGDSSTEANSSNFFGSQAGASATNAANSNFFGDSAGISAINAHDSNFLGYRTGYTATNALYSNFFGSEAGNNADNASYSNFLGIQAGKNATNAASSTFIGAFAGLAATGAYNSIFVGTNAGNGASSANNATFLGEGAGSGATSAFVSNFLGYQAGYNASGAGYSNFIGSEAGSGASGATGSNFLGVLTGKDAISATDANFFGRQAGQGASNAFNSNFLGYQAGYQATNASQSNFIGETAGWAAVNAAGSIFIGTSAGYNDTVDNTTNSGTSIAIGRLSGTGGFSNSIALGRGVINSAAQQLNVANVLYATGIYNSDTQTASPVSGGRLGVGTSSPIATLSVQGSGDATVLTAYSSGNTQLFSVLDSGVANLTSGIINTVNSSNYIFGKGYSSLGSGNINIGNSNLSSNTSGGNSNIALGASVLSSNTTGDHNIGLGENALGSNSAGVFSVGIGANSLYNNTSDYNVGLGYQAGIGITSGSSNVALGYNSGRSLTTGNGSIAVGAETYFASSTANGQLNIGNLLFGSLPATSTSFRLPTTGAVGIATSSSFATLGVHANSGSTNTTLFAIGSSTASATTTLFSVSNTGTTTLGNFGACSGANALTTDVSGNISCGAISGGSFPFTPTTSFGTAANSTSTLTLFTNGISASSTVRFGNANGSIFSFDSSTGRLGLGTSTPFAQLALIATSTTGVGSPTNLFAIASSTGGTATTTLFSVSNTGTTTLGRFGACNTSSALTTDTSGNITCGAITGTGDGVGTWFAPTTFGSTAANATSTLIGFNAGLYALASSTIGGGSQAGGLTVSGGATTTGSAYIGGKLGIQTVPAATAVLDVNGVSLLRGSLVVGGSTVTVEGNEFFASSGFGSATGAAYLFGGASGLYTTGAFNNAGGGTMAPNNSASILSIVSENSMTEAASGNHPLLGSLFIKPPAITSGAATVSNTATVYIEGAPSATVSGGQYSIWSNTGDNRFDQSVIVGASTTPFAKLVIHASSTESKTTLFAIASSTASATTTLFSVSNTGTTTLGLFGACSGANALTTNANGQISCGAITGTGDGVGTWFTPTTNFGAAANSTSTPIWFTQGLQASSTSKFVNQAVSGTIDLATSTASATTTLMTLNGFKFLTAVTDGGNAANLSLGYRALESNIYNSADFTGIANTAIGYRTLSANTSGTNNTALGSNALLVNVTGFSNVAIGDATLSQSGSGDSNVAVGSGASKLATAPVGTVAVGREAACGGSCAQSFAASGYTALGYRAGYGFRTGADYNTVIGYQAGSAISTGFSNIVIGASQTANNLTSGRGNILIGNNIFATSSTAVNSLNIGGLLFGNLPATSTSFREPTSGSIGVGTSSPFAKFSIHNNNGDTENVLFAIGSSTASATTTLFSVSNTGNTGIGIDAPTEKLHIYGASGQQGIALQSNTTVLNFYANDAFGGYTTFGPSSNVPLLFQTNASEKMRITADGAFGFGTTTPFSRFALHAGATDPVYTTLFSIASSTAAYATSTLFSISNTGSIDTALSSGCIQADSNGVLTSSGSNCGTGGGGGFDFTPDSYSGTLVNSTTTPLWLKGTSPFSLIASSTFSTYSSTTQLTVSGGQLYFSSPATTTINIGGPYSFTIATSTTGLPLFAIDGTTGTTTIGARGGDVIIGDVGFPANLVFEESSSINAQGLGTLSFGTSGDILRFNASATTSAFTIASTTDASPNAIVNVSLSSDGATSTIGFFVSTSTLLAAGNGIASPSALQNYIIVGNGKKQAGIGIVNGGICVDNDGWCMASTSGRISSRTSTTGGTDLAEIYFSSTTLQAGDIVAADGGAAVKAALTDTRHMAIGIVATDPGFILGVGPDEAPGAGRYPVALAGRVPTKVNLDNGPIKIGDRIAVSRSNPGVGMKAGPFDTSVAVALEEFKGSDSQTSGLILGFINLNHRDSVETLAQAIASSTATTSQEVLLQGPFAAASSLVKDAITSVLGAIQNISQIGVKNLGAAIYATVGVFDNLISTTITADTVKAKTLCLDDVCITKTELQRLLNGSGSTGGSSSGGVSSPAPTSTPDPAPDTSTATTTDPTPTPDPTTTTDPAPASDPAPAPDATSSSDPTPVANPAPSSESTSPDPVL